LQAYSRLYFLKVHFMWGTAHSATLFACMVAVFGGVVSRIVFVDNVFRPDQPPRKTSVTRLSFVYSDPFFTVLIAHFSRPPCGAARNGLDEKLSARVAAFRRQHFGPPGR
jgi:hypothetical protein